jgi:protein TonB
VRSSPTARRSSNGEGDAVGGPTVGARLVGVSKPKYPTLSRRSGEEGTVLLSVEIHPDGTHGAIRMVRSSGHWRLDQAAARALERATFIPAKNDGKPVASRKQIAFIFRLVDAED